MIRRALLAIALLAISGAAAAAPIVDGSAASPGEFPTAVEIDYGSASAVTCSGVIVGSDWVMTSAACITPANVGVADQAAVTTAIRVQIGTIDVGSPGTTATAATTIPDPSFGSATPGQYDLGLVQLSAPVPASITPSLVNLHPEDAPIGTVVHQVGFGATGSAADDQGIERDFRATAVACAQIGAGFANDDNLLCFAQGNGGLCARDQGGPGFATIGSGAKVAGIASFSDPTCLVYGAETRTDAEFAFLLAHAPILECRSDDDCVNSTMCSGSGQCGTMGTGGTDAPPMTPSSGGCCEVGGGNGGGAMLLALAVVVVRLTRRPSSRRCRSRPRAAR